MKNKYEHTRAELQEIARKATERAWNENFALGLPIIIEENGNIIKKYKDGRVEIIQEGKNKKKTVE